MSNKIYIPEYDISGNETDRSKRRYYRLQKDSIIRDPAIHGRSFWEEYEELMFSGNEFDINELYEKHRRRKLVLAVNANMAQN